MQCSERRASCYDRGQSRSWSIVKIDGPVKSQKILVIVIPVKTGILENKLLMDSRFRGSDGLGDFLRVHQCLDLLLKLMETEMRHRSLLTRIPVARNRDNLKITNFIHLNFHKKLKFPDFTNVLHYSERHPSRILKDDLRISIFEYLKLYRILQSSLMLCNQDNSKTITEIALSCGYDSLSSFYKDFKDIFSMTPKAFRKEKSCGRLQDDS